MRANERKPLITSIYTADPSAHVYNGKIYIYPSHDFEHDCPDDDNGDQYIMKDYHILSMDNLDDPCVDNGLALSEDDVPWVSGQMWAPDSAFVDGKYYLPTDEEISAEMAKLCFDKLVLTSFPSSGAYSVSLPVGAELTLAAVAKGCARENAIDAMRQAGVESAFISMGCNVQTLGVKPDGSLWTVGIQDPANPATHLGVISVGETAVVTSAAYQDQFTAMNGRTYGHILNPSTGYPANNSLNSVTIICEDGTMADCLSTAMYVMGENKALNYWRQYGGFEMILVTDSKRVICTSGLIEKFTLVNDSYTLKFSE